MSPDGPTGKVVVVTGASSGIGAAIAERLAGDGHTVVAAARRRERLEVLRRRCANLPGSVEPHTVDVTDREQVQALVSGAAADHGRVDVLVNNAGIMPLSRLDALRLEEWDRMVDVNLGGLLNGIAAALPVFQRQHGGHFVTIASVGAHEVVPTSAVYSATKFAAWAVTEGLRQEVEPTIRVTTVSPGVTTSELAEHVADPHAREFVAAYRASAIPAAAVADTVAWAISMPADVDVNEVVIRPTAQR